jgi:hypothetical protein
LNGYAEDSQWVNGVTIQVAGSPEWLWRRQMPKTVNGILTIQVAGHFLAVKTSQY